ncbi:MAG TPA: IS110 family transposase [Terriglobia bacterium]|nr:IS110 family transposase [Terriglobia bacterium]
MIFVGIDWAEAHHDVCLVDEAGQVLARRRVAEGLEGVGKLHALIAEYSEEPTSVVVGIETDRGLLVGSLVAAGYQVFAINPMAASRYRDRHATSGAKSDPGDARVLADLVRTDRHQHRPVAGDSELAEAVKVLARAHQALIWTRQRQVNQLRNMLREFYPGALSAFEDLDAADALAILEMAPTPNRGRALSRAKIASALRRAGRRNAEDKAARVQSHLRLPQLEAPALVAQAYGYSVAAGVAVIKQLNQQIKSLEQELATSFETHPDAEIYLSLPGLGRVLGARALAEFGDDRTRFAHPKARKNYAGTAPVTKASGTRKVVLARVARNRRLADACYRWAFSALTTSAGARRRYDALRARGQTHHQALRALGNRLVGILHGCLASRETYREDVAWRTALEVAA